MAKIFSTHRRMIKGLNELDNANKTCHLLSLVVIDGHW